MKIEEVTMYEIDGSLFPSRREAENYLKSTNFKRKIASILSNFFYSSIDLEEVVEGLTEYRSELLEVLKENE